MGTASPKLSILLVLLFVLVSIAFIVLDDQSALNPLKTGLRNLITPVTDFANDHTRTDPATEGEWEAKYHDLDSKYAELEADYERALVQVQQVQSLQAMLNLRQTSPDVTLLPAHVISVDPNGSSKIIVIDQGSAEGVSVGMAVTDPNYYVGVVTKVEDHSAQVLLAIDSSHTVGAELQGDGTTTNETGVVYGMWQSGGRLEIRYVSGNAKLQPEQKVITTCSPEIRTANMPCGLIIGKIAAEPQVTNQGDVETIQVIPAADFDNLTIVAVITSTGQE